jgi:MFS family permease
MKPKNEFFPPFTSQQKRILFLSSLGGVLEFYDFIIYIFLAPFIEKIFFADSSQYIATLKTLAIFSVGYLIRPLGGIVFSHFGDRYGRKVVFLLTVIFMALPSFAIGLLPTTAQIGIAAPILLLAFRIMQGLALGGEIPASITFVSEHVSGKRRGLALAILFFGINLGLLLGSLVTTMMTSLVPQEGILAYAWRVPFILGGFFGLIAIYLRRYLRETAAFSELSEIEVQRFPAVTLIRNSWRQVLQGLLLVSLGSVTVFFYLYWPQYLHQYMHYDLAQMMRVNTIGTLLLNVMIILGGLAGDRFGYRQVYSACAGFLVIFTYPLFLMFNQESVALVVASYMIFSIIFGFIPSAYSAILSGLFRTSVRYSGIAMSYNFAYAIFGGLSPVICTVAIHYFDSVLAPAFYIMAIALCSTIACFMGRNSVIHGNK